MVSRRLHNPVKKANPPSFPGPDSPLENTPHKTRVERDGAMPAAGALVDVTAECRSAATDDGGQDLQMQPGEPFPTALVKGGSGCQTGSLQVALSKTLRQSRFAPLLEADLPERFRYSPRT